MTTLVALLLEVSGRIIRSLDGSVAAVSTGDIESGLNRNVVLIDDCIHIISERNGVTLGSTVDKHQSAILLKNVHISSASDTALSDIELRVVDVHGHALPSASGVLHPGNTLSVHQEPVIEKRVHVLSAVVQLAVVIKIVIAFISVGTPDDSELLSVKNTGQASEVAVPTPQVVVVGVDVVYRSSNNLTIVVQHSCVEAHVERARDELRKLSSESQNAQKSKSSK